MLIRVAVALVVLVPYMLLYGREAPIYVTFGVAIVAFGLGRLVQSAMDRGKAQPKA
jgi:hypothetical protein